MGRIRIKNGDIFEISLGDSKAYLQYVFQDIEYLGGHLIRVFNYQEPKTEIQVDLKNILISGIRFYAYTRLTQGIDEDMWHRIGNIPIEKNFEAPIFRQTPDSYAKVKKSYRWNIFRAGTPERTEIGEVTQKYKHLPIAGVKPPFAVVDQIKNGWDGFLRPE